MESHYQQHQTKIKKQSHQTNLRSSHGRLALLELLAEEKRAVEELKAFLE
jgi:Fe2+ or Zn2+ uptake regulation protein